MAIKIYDEVIQATAVEAIKDALLEAEKATGGAITVGRNIHKGDFLERTFFANFGSPKRRDPNTQTAVTPDRLSTLEDAGVKLYFRDDVFATFTELERYGTDLKTFNKQIGKQLGTAVARWAIQKGIVSLIGAISSQSALVIGDGTAEPSVDLLNDAVWAFGDMSEDVKVFVAPSAVTYKLTKGAIASSTDPIAYGAVYKSEIGTLGRKLWTVDAAALTAGGNKVLALTEGSVVVDESEAIKMLSQLDTLNENAGYNFHTEGAYTVDVKGFAYDKTAGANPDDSVLGADSSWNLISQLKNAAGALVKVA